MNQSNTIKKFISRTVYKAYYQYPPCNIDICICIVNLNLKDSYNDLLHYRKCYNNKLHLSRGDFNKKYRNIS